MKEILKRMFGRKNEVLSACRHENIVLLREVPNIWPPNAVTKVIECADCGARQTQAFLSGEFFGAL